MDGSSESRPGVSPAVIVGGVVGCLGLLAILGGVMFLGAGAGFYTARERAMVAEQARAQMEAERAAVERERAAVVERERSSLLGPGAPLPAHRAETPTSVAVDDGRGNSLFLALGPEGPTHALFGFGARVRVDGDRAIWTHDVGVQSRVLSGADDVLVYRRQGGPPTLRNHTSRVPLAQVLETVLTTDPAALDLALLADQVTGEAQAGPR